MDIVKSMKSKADPSSYVTRAQPGEIEMEELDDGAFEGNVYVQMGSQRIEVRLEDRSMTVGDILKEATLIFQDNTDEAIEVYSACILLGP